MLSLVTPCTYSSYFPIFVTIDLKTKKNSI